MRLALVEYQKQQSDDWPKEKFSIRALAHKFNVPFTTFYHRTTGNVEGYQHASGHKGHAQLPPAKIKGLQTSQK